MNYYRRYVGDFQRDTGHLSLAEVGAYDRLLDHYYAKEEPLPVSVEILYRICRATSAEERAAVDSVAGQFFPILGSERRNRRAEHEIRVSKSARDNGRRGGNPWIKEHYNEPGYLYAVAGDGGGEVKLGITVDPKRRFSEHKSNGLGKKIFCLPVAKMGEAERGVLAEFENEAEGERIAITEDDYPRLVAAAERYRVADHLPGTVGARVPEPVPGREGESVPGTGHPPASSLQPLSSKPPASEPPARTRVLAISDGAPDWLPIEAWNDYVTMRVKIRKPLTARAARLALDKLGALREAGHDPKAVLDQSTFQSWQGLFEPKDSGRGAKSASAVERFVSGGGRA